MPNDHAPANVGQSLYEALFDLKAAYSKVQEHYGFKPDQSPLIQAANKALKDWTAISK